MGNLNNYLSTLNKETIQAFKGFDKLNIQDKINFCINNPILGRLRLQGNLKHFIQVFHFLTTNQEFQIKDFHLELIKKLQDIVGYEQKNLLIEMPPRAGKSETINYFICWTYTINPFCNNIVTCYSDDLVGKFSKKMKHIIDTELYQKLFNLKLSNDTHSVGLWKLLGGGETRAISINGSITGFGCGVKGEEYGGALIIDDPMKAGEARSEVLRKKVVDQYNETLKSRLNNLEKTPTIIIMQRLHKYDLAGYIEEEINAGRLDKNKWDILKICAIKEDGSSFWSEAYPIGSLEELRKADPYTFNAQYQQNPVSMNRNFFNTDMFEEANIPEDMDYSYITADTAYKDGQDNDYTVFSVFGVKDKKLYLCDILRKKLKAVDIESLAIPFIQKNTSYGFEGAYIEPKGHGIYLNQALCDKDIVMPREEEIAEFFKDRRNDKVTRANAIMPFFTNKKLFINKDLQDGVKNEIIGECINFPDGLHDDIVDTIIDGCKKYMNKEVFNPYAW